MRSFDRQASSKRIGIDSRGHLRILGLRGGDEGNYSCVASNMAGDRESKSLALVVLSESVEMMSRPNQSCSGRFFHMPCQEGDFELAHLTYIGKLGLFRALLALWGLTLISDSGRKCGRISLCGIFVTEPPMITTAPRNSTILVGSDVLLSCTANGEPVPRVSDTLIYDLLSSS